MYSSVDYNRKKYQLNCDDFFLNVLASPGFMKVQKMPGERKWYLTF